MITKIFFYVNNIEKVSKTISTFKLNSTYPLRIGSGATEAIVAKYNYTGNVYDFRYFNRAITTKEMDKIYLGGPPTINTRNFMNGLDH